MSITEWWPVLNTGPSVQRARFPWFVQTAKTDDCVPHPTLEKTEANGSSAVCLMLGILWTAEPGSQPNQKHLPEDWSSLWRCCNEFSSFKRALYMTHFNATTNYWNYTITKDGVLLLGTSFSQRSYRETW